MPQKIDSILNGGREVCSSIGTFFCKKLIFSKKMHISQILLDIS